MIKRYFANKDNTITNAFEDNLKTRGTGSNMGSSDVLEVFSIYGQESSGSAELARVLIEFDSTVIASDRSAGTIADSGSVSWFLRMYDAPHSQTTPRNFKLVVSAVSASWQEGTGLDMENYQDVTRNGEGSNWINGGKKGAATATITISGNPTSTETIVFIDANGTSQTNTAGNQESGAGNAGGTFFDPRGTVTNVRDALLASINNGSAAIVATSLSTDKIVVTQNVAGPAGDSVITNGLTNVAVVGASGSSNRFDGGGKWVTVGGDYHTLHTPEQTFNTGFEDLEIDVTHMVEDWLASRKSNYGFGIRLTSSMEAYHSSSNAQPSGSVLHNPNGAVKSYYRKKFFGRDSEFFFKRPTLEARWDDSKRDDRGNFFFSSSLAPAADNLNTLYCYNYVRGRLRNIPSIGTGSIMVSLYSGSGVTPSGPAITLVGDGTHVRSNWPLVATGSHVSTGIYKAVLAVTGSPSLTTVYDVWFSGSNSVTSSLGASRLFMTGAIKPSFLTASQVTENQNYVLSMPNLRETYRQSDTPKLRLYVRNKNWNPNIYNTAVVKSIPSLLIESASYQIKRAIDDEIVVPYGTGSYYHTGLSYDVSGNYFKIDMGLLEKGYQYEIYYSFYNEDTLGYVEQPYKFKFRVNEE